MTSCRLQDLSRPETRGGLLAGLKIEGGRLCLDEKFFACCQGSAQIFDAQKNSSVVCGLKQRFAKVKALFDQYYRTWGQRFPLLPQDINKKANIVLEDLKSQQAKSAFLSKTSSLDHPSQLWEKALAYAWRFSANVHFVEFEKARIQDLLPREQSEKSFIFVGNIQKLSDPSDAFNLEEIISFAYHTQAKLFLEFVEMRSASATKKTNAGYFANRIATLNDKSPLKFLQRDAYSRLMSMSGLGNATQGYT